MKMAFSIQRSKQIIAIVGGGGKTSLLFALAKALPGRVVITTTTRIFSAQMKLAPAVCLADDLDQLGTHLDRFGQCLIVGAVGSGRNKEKVLGVAASLPGQLLARPDVDYVLVEADGSRMRPIKAPDTHEPVIPPDTRLVIPMAGIDAVDGRIKDVAHRPELLAAIISRPSSVQHRLTPEDVADLFTHPLGGLKGVPKGARIIPFLNKVETAEQLAAARQVAKLTLHTSRITQVVIGAVQSEKPIREVHKRVTAVVLAAGASNRMGQTKQLLPWDDTTVLGRVLRNVKETAVHDCLVVTGHDAENVASVAAAEGQPTVFNPQFAFGDMLSSLQTAVRHLPEDTEAILVILADQPFVEAPTMNLLLEAYWQRQGEIIAPIYNGQRGNPVLIGRPFFQELLALPYNSAPRELLQRHSDLVHLVPVGTNTILRDLDRMEDYARWRPQIK